MKFNVRIVVLILLGYCLFWGVSANKPADLKFHHLTVNNGLPQNSVYSIVKDKYGFMWFGTWGGAARYDGYHLKLFRPHENDTTALPDYRISCLVTDSLQNIWIETENPLYFFKYSYEADNFIRRLKSKAPTQVKQEVRRWHRNLYKTTQNKTYRWTASDNGLIQTNLATGRTKLYQKNSATPFALSDNLLKNIYLDDEDNLWIGTLSGGVNYTNLYFKPFTNYYHQSEVGKGLIDNVVRAVCVDDDGRIWVGSENSGITIIDVSSGTPSFAYVADKGLEDKKIRSLLCAKDGTIWVGTKDGLFAIKNAKLDFNAYDTKAFNHNIFALHEDDDNNLWIGTLYGLVLYNREAKSFQQYSGKSISSGNYIRDILEDKHHNLWLATEDAGVTKLVRKNNQTDTIAFVSTPFLHRVGVKNGLPSNRTYALTQDSLGMIWVATDAGISRINPDNNHVTTFSVDNGLPDNLTMALLCDADNKIWVSHKKGISRVDAGTFEIQNFDINDGLQSNEFNQSACFRNRHTGELFFGGINGLTSFFPQEVRPNPHPPRVVLTELYVMHQKIKPGQTFNKRVILDKTLLCTDEITLTWWDKTFRIEFAALHYANALDNTYKYRLDGFDTEWINATADIRQASYSNLKAGTYKFKVMAANSDGVWCTQPTVLTIYVLPPWWLTTWAFIIYFVAACVLGWMGFVYMMSRIKLKEKEKAHQGKLTFFTELSHEFRTPLTLIIDPLEKLISEKVAPTTVAHYYTMMHRNAKQLLLLINQLLDFRKLEAGHFTLNLNQGDIVSFMKSALAAFETLAAERRITLEVTSEVPHLKMAYDENKLNMVFNNLLSNALKFTTDLGKVSIHIETNNVEIGFVKISVFDTGTGIAKAELDKIFDLFYQSRSTQNKHVGSGIGLSLTRELVLLHGGFIEVKSRIGEGTAFAVKLPIRQVAADENGANSVAEPEGQMVNFDKDKGCVAAGQVSDKVLLVVDDNVDIRNYIALNFNTQFKVLKADNGVAGWQQAVDAIPDIIICDVMMPDMDGFELCEKLKSDQRTSHIPVIMLTARQTDEAVTIGYNTGADAYLTKPFNTNVLGARIANLLQQRQTLRELFSSGSGAELKQIAVNKADAEFLEKVTKIIDENLDKPNFDIDLLAEKVGMSRSQFYRKIKALTNKSGNEFITTFRMNKAAKILISGYCNISETAYKVGYTAPNSFTRAFVKYYGLSPSDFIESRMKN